MKGVSKTTQKYITFSVLVDNSYGNHKHISLYLMLMAVLALGHVLAVR